MKETNVKYVSKYYSPYCCVMLNPKVPKSHSLPTAYLPTYLEPNEHVLSIVSLLNCLRQVTCVRCSCHRSLPLVCRCLSCSVCEGNEGERE